MRRKIKFQELVNNFIPYDDEMLFEVFRWMIQTGWEHRSWPYFGSSGVFEWIYGLSSTGSQYYWQTHGFSDCYTWDGIMKMAFVRAIVCQDGSSYVHTWRKTEGIYLDKYRMLDLRIDPFKPCKIHELLSESWSKKLLTTQLNSIYEKAIKIHSIMLSTDGNQWRCDLNYGFGHSSWSHRLADQGNDPFSYFIEKALTNLEVLTNS